MTNDNDNYRNNENIYGNDRLYTLNAKRLTINAKLQRRPYAYTPFCDNNKEMES